MKWKRDKEPISCNQSVFFIEEISIYQNNEIRKEKAL